MHLFYEPDLAGTTAELNEEESHHLVKVLRLRVADRIRLTDGKGAFYEAEILSTSGKKAHLSILSKEEHAPPKANLHIAIAPTKNIERIELFLEKATEMGITEVSLLLCNRSERRNVRLDRLEKVLVSAAKQSLKPYMPKLNDLESFDKFLQRPNLPQARYIAYCGEGKKREIAKTIQPNANFLVLIGPEGDFTPVEVELAQRAGFEQLTLGNARLRTETAGIFVASVFNFVNL